MGSIQDFSRIWKKQGSGQSFQSQNILKVITVKRKSGVLFNDTSERGKGTSLENLSEKTMVSKNLKVMPHRLPARQERFQEPGGCCPTALSDHSKRRWSKRGLWEWLLSNAEDLQRPRKPTLVFERVIRDWTGKNSSKWRDNCPQLSTGK